MIVFSGIIPHSPILAPSLIGNHAETLQRTRSAMTEFEGALYLARPETLVILSPHAHQFPDAFSGNASPLFHAGLIRFGDHGTSLTIKSDTLLLDRLQRSLRKDQVPFALSGEPDLDYGFTVPLLYLTPHLPGIKLVPLSVSALNPHAHVQFGKSIHQVLQAEQTRVAVIASADLGHHGPPNAPPNPESPPAQFDALMRAKVGNEDLAGLLGMNPALLKDANQCGYKPILTHMSIMNGLQSTIQELCYEAPLGVGLLTAIYHLT